MTSSSNMNSNAKLAQAFPSPKDYPHTKLTTGHQQKPEHRQKSPGHKPTEKESKADILKGIDDDVEREWGNSFPFVEVDLSTGRIETLKPILFAKSKTGMEPEINYVLRQAAKTPKGLETVSGNTGLPLAHFPVEGHTKCTDVKERSNHYHVNVSTKRLTVKYSNIDLQHTIRDQ